MGRGALSAGLGRHQGHSRTSAGRSSWIQRMPVRTSTPEQAKAAVGLDADAEED